MAAPSFLAGSDWSETSPRRRIAGLVGAAIVHLLLLALLLNLAPPWEKRTPPAGSITILPLPPSPDEPAVRRSPKPAAQRSDGGAPPAPAAPPPPTTPRQADQPAAPWVLNPELQGFNLSQVPRTATIGAGQGTAQGDQAGDDAGESGGGGAPGSGKLFPVRWYREPTSAELQPYLPRNHPAGWGEVACRTTARFHVEDCEEIGQSPAGSGLSRAVREAAWQFLVRPPRLNGKDLVGAPVRIRITYYENGSIGLGGGAP